MMIKKIITIIVFLLVIVSNAWSDISIGNTASMGDNPITSSFSLNNNKTSVIVGLVFRDDTTFSGVTYNGVSMTQAATATDGVSVDCYIFYLANASSGANDVAFTSDGDYWGWAIAVDGLDLRDIDASNSTTGTSTTPSVSITTVAAKTLIVDAVYHKNSGTLAQDSPQVLIGRASIRSNSDEGGGSYQVVTSSGADTMSWSIGASDGWLTLAVSFRGRRVMITQ